MPEPSTDIFLKTLHDYWGYPDFRGVQREIIESIASGHDTLGIMPTGGGKSLTFQVPTLAKNGLALVISPLVALMKDQVSALKKIRQSIAETINNETSLSNVDRILGNCATGHCHFLYVSPERLRNQGFVQTICQLRVTMIVVDEAHCISQWGHDFRPPYRQIAGIRPFFPNVPILALTATATAKVKDDIIQQLNLVEPNVFTTSLERENISYIVKKTYSKETDLIDILNENGGSAIVYIRDRQRTVEIAQTLLASGLSAYHFHAGMENKIKNQVQNDWTKDKIKIIVATNAFGMGIDKPDVRTVIHLTAPDSLEAYFQEAGRAGRDGEPSKAILLWSEDDEQGMRRKIKEKYPPKKEIIDIYDHLGNFYQLPIGEGMGVVKDFDLKRYCTAYHKSYNAVKASLSILSQAGYISHSGLSELEPQVMFRINRQELYEVEEKYPQYVGVIHSLLRNYTGLFIEYARVDVQLLAEQSKLTVDDVLKIFRSLQNMEVLAYRKAINSESITYTVERQDPKLMAIPKAVYEDLKIAEEARLEAMINYCKQDTSCRVQMMLDYFGQEGSPKNCTCDVCQGKIKTLTSLANKNVKKNSNSTDIEKYITDRLTGESLSFDDLCKTKEFGDHAVKWILRQMIDIGIVNIDTYTCSLNQ